METYPLGLALFDFVPVTIFLVGAYFLVRLAMHCRSRPTGRMAMAGALLIFLGGFLKALWKLLYTINIGNYRWMSELQFSLVAPGFLALLVTAIYIALSQHKAPRLAPVLALAGWKIPLLILMTLSAVAAHGILAFLAFRRERFIAAVGFITAFICTLGMGGLASGEQTVARQWLAESVNTMGQSGFALGCYLLYRDYAVPRKECE
ncbi:hypothetical protein [uncultured Thermanaerothrix sp.]|uniref:hypothetical protein n=1 Tax=uncultured Thermanaerothrix sp. TaxID=1195149 RepID=UPI002606C031|nr:hypothetical protein [uncultured Thermanaerothrix sp.]